MTRRIYRTGGASLAAASMLAATLPSAAAPPQRRRGPSHSRRPLRAIRTASSRLPRTLSSRLRCRATMLSPRRPRATRAVSRRLRCRATSSAPAGPGLRPAAASAGLLQSSAAAAGLRPAAAPAGLLNQAPPPQGYGQPPPPQATPPPPPPPLPLSSPPRPPPSRSPPPPSSPPPSPQAPPPQGYGQPPLRRLLQSAAAAGLRPAAASAGLLQSSAAAAGLRPAAAPAGLFPGRSVRSRRGPAPIPAPPAATTRGRRRPTRPTPSSVRLGRPLLRRQAQPERRGRRVDRGNPRRRDRRGRHGRAEAPSSAALWAQAPARRSPEPGPGRLPARLHRARRRPGVRLCRPGLRPQLAPPGYRPGSGRAAGGSSTRIVPGTGAITAITATGEAPFDPRPVELWPDWARSSRPQPEGR